MVIFVAAEHSSDCQPSVFHVCVVSESKHRSKKGEEKPYLSVRQPSVALIATL